MQRFRIQGRQWVARLLGCALLTGIVGWLYYLPTSQTFRDGVSDILESHTSQPPKYALHVLFVGNSYTYVYDIPGKLVAIASSDAGSDTQLVVQSVTRGGVSLKELWEDGKALSVLQGAHWDDVVIQQHSFWALGAIEETAFYASQFDKAIRSMGARTWLYLTWPRKPGSFWYADPQYSFLENPDHMLHAFISRTNDLARKLDARVAPVGIYWAYALSQHPEIELYGPDGHHPGEAGAYLAALVFYKSLTGRDVRQTSYVPDGMNAEAARALRDVVGSN